MPTDNIPNREPVQCHVPKPEQEIVMHQETVPKINVEDTTAKMQKTEEHCFPEVKDLYDSNPDGKLIEVSGATGGMSSVNGFYKRFSSVGESHELVRPYHHSSWSHNKRANAEARKQRAWQKECGGRDWFLRTDGRVIRYDGRQWVLTQDAGRRGGGEMAIYVNPSKDLEVPTGHVKGEEWFFKRPESQGGVDTSLQFFIDPKPKE